MRKAVCLFDAHHMGQSIENTDQKCYQQRKLIPTEPGFILFHSLFLKTSIYSQTSSETFLWIEDNGYCRNLQWVSCREQESMRVLSKNRTRISIPEAQGSLRKMGWKDCKNHKSGKTRSSIFWSWQDNSIWTHQLWLPAQDLYQIKPIDILAHMRTGIRNPQT